MMTSEDIAQLPLIGAAYYDKFAAENQAIARMMTRQDYIDSYVRMQLALAGYTLNTVINSGSTGREEPTVAQTAAEVKTAVEAQR